MLLKKSVRGDVVRFKAKIMDEKSINRSITRIAHEILEKNKGTENIVLVGIKTRGVPFARRIAKKIREFEESSVEIGVIDITLYRDDLEEIDIKPVVNNPEIAADYNGKIVVLLDDVIYTGRTVRAAMDAIMDRGRPSSIQLGVLVDRGHKELPIRADFVGKNVPTSKTEVVEVHFEETDGLDEVVISELK